MPNKLIGRFDSFSLFYFKIPQYLGLICSLTLVDQTHSVVIQVQPDDLILQEVNDRPIIGNHS